MVACCSPGIYKLLLSEHVCKWNVTGKKNALDILGFEMISKKRTLRLLTGHYKLTLQVLRFRLEIKTFTATREYFYFEFFLRSPNAYRPLL